MLQLYTIMALSRPYLNYQYYSITIYYFNFFFIYNGNNPLSTLITTIVAFIKFVYNPQYSSVTYKASIVEKLQGSYIETCTIGIQLLFVNEVENTLTSHILTCHN